MQFVIITGISGAGKSTALKMLEDSGFFCVDNLPPLLIGKFADICFSPDSGLNKIALGIDIRGGHLFESFYTALDEIKHRNNDIQMLYLDSSDEVLIKRFKETRRKHPLVENGRIGDGITLERELLQGLKQRADHILDTSNLLTRELKKTLLEIVIGGKSYENIMITVLSFGFKYGIPSDSDLVFDVRFLPNPFYKSELRHLTGNDKTVQDFVMQWETAQTFITKLEDMVQFLLPHYIQEGKNQLVISIGCTGGKHRSVTLANELLRKLERSAYSVNIHHRDIYKDTMNGK